MNCDICGSEERLFRALIEGTELSVCKKCGRFGKIIAEIMPEKKEEIVPYLKKFEQALGRNKEIKKIHKAVKVLCKKFPAYSTTNYKS